MKRSHINGHKAHFTPRADITAYELALILQRRMYDGFVNSEFIPEGLERHFTPVESPAWSSSDPRILEEHRHELGG